MAYIMIQGVLKLVNPRGDVSYLLEKQGLLEVLLELFTVELTLTRMLLMQLLVLGFLYLFISVFIAAGVFPSLVNRERSGLINLVVQSLGNLMLFLRLYLVYLPAWIFSALLAFAGFFVWFEILADPARPAWTKFSLVLFAAFTLFVFILNRLLFDLARLIHAQEGKSCLGSIFRAARLLAGNTRSLLVMTLLYSLTLLAAALPLFIIGQSLEQIISLPLFAAFICGQVFILMRLFLRTSLLRSLTFFTQH